MRLEREILGFMQKYKNTYIYTYMYVRVCVCVSNTGPSTRIEHYIYDGMFVLLAEALAAVDGQNLANAVKGIS